MVRGSFYVTDVDVIDPDTDQVVMVSVPYDADVADDSDTMEAPSTPFTFRAPRAEGFHVGQTVRVEVR